MYAADVRVPGEAGEGAVELLVVGAVVLHRRSPGLWMIGDDAVDVRVVLQQARRRGRARRCTCSCWPSS